jgi:hypothetical protein
MGFLKVSSLMKIVEKYLRVNETPETALLSRLHQLSHSSFSGG